jgi:saccharopine dehydrogenase-like NADP-dependent oxidoreductase
MAPEGHRPTVVVLGGAGYFGRLLVEDLLATTAAQLVVVGRNRARLARLARALDPAGTRLGVRALDVRDRGGLAALARPGDVVIDCAGPFQTRGLEALETAVACGAHYIDIADARGFLARVRERREEWDRSAATVISGASAVPGLIVLLARRAAELGATIDAVSTWMAPGNRDPRRHGTVYSLLVELGVPFPMLCEGRLVRATPWSRPQTVAFPAPVGDRIGYLMSGVDSDVLPEYFPGIRTCELRVGSEVQLLNAAVGLLRPIAQAAPRWFRAAVPLFRTVMALCGWLGSSAGGMLVRVRGTRAGQPVSVTLALTRERVAPVIAVIPASVAVSKVLAGTMLPRRGWVPLDALLTHEELVAEFGKRGCAVNERVDPGAGSGWDTGCRGE